MCYMEVIQIGYYLEPVSQHTSFSKCHHYDYSWISPLGCRKNQMWQGARFGVIARVKDSFDAHQPSSRVHQRVFRSYRPLEFANKFFTNLAHVQNFINNSVHSCPTIVFIDTGCKLKIFSTSFGDLTFLSLLHHSSSLASSLSSLNLLR